MTKAAARAVKPTRPDRDFDLAETRIEQDARDVAERADREGAEPERDLRLGEARAVDPVDDDMRNKAGDDRRKSAQASSGDSSANPDRIRQMPKLPKKAQAVITASRCSCALVDAHRRDSPSQGVWE